MANYECENTAQTISFTHDWDRSLNPVFGSILTQDEILVLSSIFGDARPNGVWVDCPTDPCTQSPATAGIQSALPWLTILSTELLTGSGLPHVRIARSSREALPS